MKNPLTMRKGKLALVALWSVFVLTLWTTTISFAASTVAAASEAPASDVKSCFVANYLAEDVMLTGAAGEMTYRDDRDASEDDLIVCQIRSKWEDGVSLYSTAGGETTGEDVPVNSPDFTEVYGKFDNGLLVEEGMFFQLLTKLEDGTLLYSTDAGETWSKSPPAGVQVFMEEDGDLMVTRLVLQKVAADETEFELDLS